MNFYLNPPLKFKFVNSSLLKFVNSPYYVV